MVNSKDGFKTEASIDYDMDTWEPWIPVISGRFNITKSILFRVYRRICEAINNNLSGQYMKYLLVWNWHTDQWFDESLSRVDLIDHWSENGFAWKEHHRSEILIWILPKECTLNRGTSPGCLAGDLISP